MTTPHIKARGLAYLVEHRAQTLRPPYSVESRVTLASMGAALGVPLHDLKHAMYDLQKLDAVRFRERNRAGHGVQRGDLDRFQITRVGLQLATDEPPAMRIPERPPVDVPTLLAHVNGRELPEPEPEPTARYVPAMPPAVLELFRLRDVRLRLEALAAELDALGRNESAVAVLDQLPAMSPGELAVLDYLEAIGARP